jgi:methylmalonyl-CoA mutase C-terminal domain/subunit
MAREELERAGKADSDIMQATLDFARAGGTVGEWTSSLERVTRGRYTPVILDRSSTSAPLKVPTIDPKSRRIRIAIGKAGLDGHINAVKLLAQACMQAGMEVVLAGFKQTPDQLVETALQEDVDLLAVSSLAGAHMTIARETLELLKRRGAGDVRLVMGGIIPEEDRQSSRRRIPTSAKSSAT